MNQTAFAVLVLAGCQVAATGCMRSKPSAVKQIKVPEGGEPVLTSAERAAGEKDVNQPPRLLPQSIISRASYSGPVSESTALKPFERWTEQDAAEDALGRIGAAAVPSLVAALHDAHPSVRLKAVEVLGRMGEDAAAAVPDLVLLLDDPDESVQKAATRTLGRIGPAAKTAVPALMRKLFEPVPPEAGSPQ
jgi:HEAT repeat protein